MPPSGSWPWVDLLWIDYALCRLDRKVQGDELEVEHLKTITKAGGLYEIRKVVRSSR